MIYVIIAVVAIVLLLPLVYELPNYVYGRKSAVLPFLRWNTRFYIILLLAIMGALIADGLVMISLTSKLTFNSVRLWLGVVVGVFSLLYFLRLIPVYYDEQFDVKSKEKLTGTFVREMVAITIFAAALTAVSFYWWSFCIDGGAALFLYLSRLRRFLKCRKNRGR